MAVPGDDPVAVLVAAARGLDIRPRQWRWTHLSLCVRDAVHSINANYDYHTVPLCRRYVDLAGRHAPRLPVAEVGSVIGTEWEQPLSSFATWAHELGGERLANLLGGRQRASRHVTAPRKNYVEIGYASILLKHHIETFADATELLTDGVRLTAAEADLARVPGHGSGVWLDYLWMLIGNNERIKPDRMVLRWIAGHLGALRIPA
jgi:hypothetical protein